MNKMSAIAVAALMGACGGDDQADESTTAQASIPVVQHYSDGAHLPGTAGFYFYPNIADVSPAPTGPFNNSFKARTKVDVNQVDCNTWSFISTVASVSNPVVYNETATVQGEYRINTTATKLNMTLGSCYRIVYKLDNAQLGFRDTQVLLSSQSAAPGVKKLLSGQTINLVWRLEGTMDQDGDGVLNHVDNCPADANPGQEDSNSNGVGDACEVADADGDGVADGSDNCPNAFNPDQENGDGDLRGDACDGCPADGAKILSGKCGCGFSDADTDNDGQADGPGGVDATAACGDICPSDATKSFSADISGPAHCGCNIADTDSDGDGVAACNEACDNTAYHTGSGSGVCGCSKYSVDTNDDGSADTCADIVSCP